MNTRIKGKFFEMLAQKYLISRGFIILDKNYCGKRGEIDIIGKEDECWVFIEVKSKSKDTHGLAEEMLTENKKKKIIGTAFEYLSKKGLSPEETFFRIDCVAINLKTKKLKWFKNITSV